MSWKLFSKQKVADRTRYLWVDGSGNKIERNRGNYVWITCEGAYYDLEAQNLSEAKQEVKSQLASQTAKG